MKYLLDTHFILWLPIGGTGISRVARAIIDNSANEFQFSVASLWEIALKRARYGSNFAFDPRAIRAEMLHNGYEELPIQGSHVVAVDALPPIHKDPFDRLLIAQAMIEGITLFTVDATIARYPGPIRKV
ncbi:MAG: type II toxin-antitoxin system VapC family toxin [Terracidiphilus sp.]|jgi:PIN domain nuclease of toxin-antitoxin system